MKRYEMIREMFNSCENGRMRDIDITEIETEDVESVAMRYATGKDVKCERLVSSDGAIIFDLDSDGLNQRITFTEI